MKRFLVIGAAVVLAGALAWPYMFGPSDRQMIQEALDESVKASREGRPGGVMEYLSRSMTYNDLPVENRTEVARFIRTSRPDVTLENPTPEIHGNKAVIVTPVELKTSFGPLPIDVRLEKVQISLVKETGTRFLVLPAPKWRILEIKADNVDFSGWTN